MLSSFLKRSARKGPTPFKYSIGEANMETVWLIIQQFVEIQISV
jgi:hypothetical protein